MVLTVKRGLVSVAASMVAALVEVLLKTTGLDERELEPKTEVLSAPLNLGCLKKMVAEMGVALVVKNLREL